MRVRDVFFLESEPAWMGWHRVVAFIGGLIGIAAFIKVMVF